jgi:hypothetical protein
MKGETERDLFALLLSSVVQEVRREGVAGVTETGVHIGEKLADHIFCIGLVSAEEIGEKRVRDTSKIFFGRIVPHYFRFTPEVREGGGRIEADFGEFYLFAHSKDEFAGGLSLIGGVLAGILRRVYSLRVSVREEGRVLTVVTGE